MSFEEIEKKDSCYIAHTYNRFPTDICGGEGATLFSEDGKTFLDFGTGIAVNTFGVNDEEWKKAVTAQINCVQHTSNLYYARPAAELAELLCAKTGAKKVFFSNSGAEANECAIKAARKYSYDKYGAGRYRILTLKNSFHGRTLAALAATGQDVMHPACFAPYPEGFYSIEPTAAALRAALTPQTCALMFEPVQGESGVNVPDAEQVRAMAALCKERDVLLIADEVQTGNGRTGKLYAYEYFGICPDIVTTAKGLAGGLPLGATMFFGKCENIFGAGDHGSTFGGNPVACAGACSILRRLDKELLLEVQGKGEYLRTHLSRIKNVRSVSGIGLMIGVETAKPARELAQKCLEKGLIVLTAKNKLRLLPPLNVKKSEMDAALQILNEVISE